MKHTSPFMQVKPSCTCARAGWAARFLLFEMNTPRQARSLVLHLWDFISRNVVLVAVSDSPERTEVLACLFGLDP
jgi:hypothetical protein